MKRLLGVGTGIAVLCLVAAAMALGASKPTLIPNKHVAGLPAVTYGGTVTLSGHESLGGSRTITLQDNVWPFTGGFHTLATATTTGSYSFSVSPTHATRYRVLVGGKKSRVVTVYVLLYTVSSSCNLCDQSNTPGAHKLIVTATLQAPPGPIALHGPVYFYYGVATGTTAPSILSLVKHVPLHISGDTLSFKVTYQAHFPNAEFEFAFLTCIKGTESKDGVNLPGNHHCGDASVNRHKYIG